MKQFVVALMALAVAFAAADSPAKLGKFKLEYGWIRGADGKKHSVKGLELDVVEVIRVDPSKLKRVRPVPGKFRSGLNVRPPSGAQPHRDLDSLASELVGKSLHVNASMPSASMAQPAYSTFDVNNPNGSNIYMLSDEFPDPTTLDDVTMSGGAGKLWENLWLGFYIPADRKVLIRWQIFDDNVPPLGNGSVFDNLIGPMLASGPAGDFGGYFQPSNAVNASPPGLGTAWAGPDAYIVKLAIPPRFGWPGITCPDDVVYVGQQFREPHPSGPLFENGEGPFDAGFKTLYTADVPPVVGSSQDGFWYDWDPMNGIYGEAEYEVLGDITGTTVPFSNVLRAIEVGGTLATFGPLDYVLFGIAVSGGNIDLQDSDNEYLRFKPRWDVDRTSPNAYVEVQGTSPSSNLTSFKFNVEAGSSTGGGTMKIELWNYTTGAYDLYGTTPIPGSDQTVEVSVTSNYSRYLNSTNRRVKSRVSFFCPFDVDRTYEMRVDRMAWSVTTP